MEDEMLTVNMVAMAHRSYSSTILPVWPFKRGATILEASVFGAWFSLSHPCVLWWEAAPLWAVTNALSPSSPARQDLTLNPNAPMQIIFVQFNARRPKSPFTHIWNNQDCITSSALGLSGCVELEVIQVWSPFTPCCPLVSALMLLWFQPPLQYSTPAFLSVSSALWRIGRFPEAPC